MFGFVKRYMARRRRSIFRYWDGARNRFADPMAIYRALQQHPRFNWDVHPALIDCGDLDALALTAEAVRTAFGIAPVEQDGLTEAECVTLLAAFVGYLEALKKNGSPTPTLPAPSEPAPSTPATPDTSEPSASGSTASAPRPAERLVS